MAVRGSQQKVNRTHLKIGYIGGGSRAWAHYLMRDLALTPEFSGEVRLFDIDHEAASFNAKFGNWLQSHPQNQASWKYRAVRSLKDAMSGADFIFLSIQPGPLHWMKQDLELPMKFGIYQPVGDTVGPGGLVRGLRSARIYKGFAAAVAEYAPKAWVLNFTNPMTICTKTLHAVFPEIKGYGCCHEVFGTQALLGNLLAEKKKIPAPAREEIDVNVLGINHFTWFDKAQCRGVDLLQLAREKLDSAETRKLYTEKEIMKQCPTVFASKRRVTYELLRRFDILPAAGDRHLAEFVPWFLTDEKSCFRWGFRLTPYSYRINMWNSAPKLARRRIEGREPYELQKSNEEYINQMAALVGLKKFRTNVNLPNSGQMEGIPAGAVVETNAWFSKDKVEPVKGGRLPLVVNSLVYPHVANQESIVQAALTSDKDLAFRAFANDPLVQRLPLDRAWDLFNRMLKATDVKF